MEARRSEVVGLLRRLESKLVNPPYFDRVVQHGGTRYSHQHIGHVAQRMRELRSLEKQLKLLRQQCTQSRAVSDCRILKELSDAATPGRLAKKTRRHMSEGALIVDPPSSLSYHYLAPSEFSHAGAQTLARVVDAFNSLAVPVYSGAVWTTDAPFRETEEAIASARAQGLLAVEMEAAALYAFSAARDKRVLCFAHVTNQMGSIEGDFEKGEADGAVDALALLVVTARRFLDPSGSQPVGADLNLTHRADPILTRGWNPTT